MSKFLKDLIQKSNGGTLEESINIRISKGDKEALKYNATLANKSMSELIYLACVESGLFVKYLDTTQNTTSIDTK